MKNFDYYSKIDREYPIWKAVCSCGGRPISKNKKPNDNFCGNCGTDIKKIYESEIEKFDNQRKAYKEEEKMKYEEFKNDLFKDFGVENNPKKDKCFSLAWDRGHSFGYREVYVEFEELVDLIY